MATVFLSFFNRAMAAGWLVLAVLVLRLIFRKAPKWIFCLCWLLVGLRLVLPGSLESVLSLIPSREVVTEQTLYATVPTVTTGVGVLNSAINPVISSSLAPNPGDSVNPLQVITFVAGFFWCVGMAVMLLYCLISYLLLRRRVADAVPEVEGVYRSDRIATPFILGFFRPRIYLPMTLQEPELHYALEHEQAHLARRDHWYKPLAFLLLSVYWFHPLLWLAYILLCRDIELACDEKVIRAIGVEEKKAYSAALLSCSVSHRSIRACPLAFGEVGVKQRIVRILNYKKPAFWLILTAIVASIVLAVCFLTDPVTELPSPLDKNYEAQQVLYQTPLAETKYRPEQLPYYSVSSDGTLTRNPRASDSAQDEWLTGTELDPAMQVIDAASASEELGQLVEVELDKDIFDRYFSVREDAAFNQEQAKALRKDNHKAWRIADYDDERQIMCVLLQQKDGDVYLCMGWLDGEGENDYHSDDSSFLYVLKLREFAEPLPEETAGTYQAGLFVGQYMALSFQPHDGTDLGVFTVEDGKITSFAQTDGSKKESLNLSERRTISVQELADELEQEMILLQKSMPEGETVQIEEYTSIAASTTEPRIVRYVFSDGTAWIECFGRIYEFVSEGTEIPPWQPPTGEDIPVEHEWQAQLNPELTPLEAAIVDEVRAHNWTTINNTVWTVNFETLAEITLMAAGEEEESSFQYQVRQLLLAALYQEFDPAIGCDEPVTENFLLVSVQLREADNGYEPISYWQTEDDWSEEIIEKVFPLSLIKEKPDLSKENRKELWLTLQKKSYAALVDAGMITVSDFSDCLKNADRLEIEYVVPSEVVREELLREEDETLFCAPLLSLPDALRDCMLEGTVPGSTCNAISIKYYQGDTELITFTLLIGHQYGWVINYSIEDGAQTGQYLYDARTEFEATSIADYSLYHNPPEGIRNLIQSIYAVMPIDDVHILAVLGQSGDPQAEIQALFDEIMAGYEAMGNDEVFREEYMDEYERILGYGDEALRFTIRAFKKGGNEGFRGNLLKEFLIRLEPSASIDLYSESHQEYFEAWARALTRQYEKLGNKAFEIYDRLDVILEELE